MQGGCAVALVAAGCAFVPVTCSPQESARIRRPPQNYDESQDLAVEVAKNDGLLRQGDIIVTRRGFLVFKGVAADGYTNEFELVPQLLNQKWIKKN